MRTRLRPAYTDEQLKQVYPETYDHTKWADHRDRIVKIIDFAGRHASGITSIADLSCGDAAIARGIKGEQDIPVVLGDFVETEGYDFTGSIEDTLLSVSIDLLILSEILEHLDDPDQVLRDARHSASRIIISTPCNETLPNPEHYWAWSAIDVASMLAAAGWEIRGLEFLEYPDLDVRYQLWYAV